MGVHAFFFFLAAGVTDFRSLGQPYLLIPQPYHYAS